MYLSGKTTLKRMTGINNGNGRRQKPHPRKRLGHASQIIDGRKDQSIRFPRLDTTLTMHDLKFFDFFFLFV